VCFVNLNVTPFDSAKHSAVSVVTDAREGLAALAEELGGWRVEDAHVASYRAHMAAWNAEVDRAFHLGHEPLPAQTEVLGALHDVLGPSDVIVQAAGSLPGDLQMLWRASEAKAYNVEYAYSCMGYEVAGGLGTKLADPGREVFVLVGDGSYLMMSQEIATAVSEDVKLTIVLVQNHGFASIGALSESVGSQRFGTSYRQRNPETGRLDGSFVPVDLAANAASLGADVIRTATVDELRAGLAKARASARTTVVEIQTDPLAPVPSSESWWDVPVAETSALDSTRAARAAYEQGKAAQRGYLRPADHDPVRVTDTADRNERDRG
jgi:3D-(3,5/4)-trihydroxycyclohexane-1,2-dione acylhydrolase (decyclizing)